MDKELVVWKYNCCIKDYFRTVESIDDGVGHLLNLGIFPKEVAEREEAYYLTKQNPYGLPLDNRKTYTKGDWIVWTATLAGDTETFGQFIDLLHRFVSETPDRVPMSDWYETTNAKKVGFQARSVVGGYFIKLLEQ